MLLPENHVGICRHKLNNGRWKSKNRRECKKKRMGIWKYNKSYQKRIRLRINSWSFWSIKWSMRVQNGIHVWKYVKINQFGTLWKSATKRNISISILLGFEKLTNRKKKSKLKLTKFNFGKCSNSIKNSLLIVKCTKFNSSLSQIHDGAYYKAWKKKMHSKNI